MAQPDADSPGVSDGALVRAAREGEKWAEEALFRRHYKAAHRFAFRLTGPGRDTEDLVQECMVAALSELDKIRNPDLFWSWLARIIVNTVYKAGRRRRLTQRLGLAPRGEIDIEAFISPGAPPDVVAELHAVYGKLGDLPERLRLVLILRRVEGLELEEIAALMDVSLATVKRWIARAAQRLEQALEGEEGSC